jgi:hypothetical protein
LLYLDRVADNLSHIVFILSLHVHTLCTTVSLFLLDKDFDQLYPGKGHCLYEKWPALADRVLHQVRTMAKDKGVLQMAGKVTGDDVDTG